MQQFELTLGWSPVFVLPNIELKVPIESEMAALVPAHDDRIRALKQNYPVFRDFLNRFSDSFGKKFEPTVLLLRANAPAAFRDITALASFRDLIAIATITCSRSRELCYPLGGSRVMFGENFAFYPWMVDGYYEGLTGRTPAFTGSHEVSEFGGQSSPSIFRGLIGESDVDQPLLSALIKIWLRRYNAEMPAVEDVALMRSLNMAYHASFMPAEAGTILYDVGRIVSLWVSVFEILIHPGDKGNADRDKVFKLIERTPWLIEDSKKIGYETSGNKKIKRTLASWLYQFIYDRRNDFLHGNPVNDNVLTIPFSEQSIFVYAAPLYRIALTASLRLTYDCPRPDTEGPEKILLYLNDREKFQEPQECAEEALLSALRPPRRPRPSRLLRSRVP